MKEPTPPHSVDSGMDMTRYDRSTSLSSNEVLRSSIGILPVLYGSRSYTDNDLEGFNDSFMMERRFNSFAPILIRDSDEISDPRELRYDYEHLSQLVTDIDKPLLVVLITTTETAEKDWFAKSPEFIRELRRVAGKPDTAVYKIIFGSSWEFSEKGRKDPNGHFTKSSMHAFDLGAIHIPYNGDAPTNSSRRLIEYMNRLVGCDLPDDVFPNYPLEDMQKMAWHINKEDFNLWYPREGAIPKYPIVDGRPVFAF